ncbi:MAG: hypothetical protein N4A49_07560, partial [Marinifilaceae bacterium]|nr:hypothetical protein [Marinifilaceae bacterium]
IANNQNTPNKNKTDIEGINSSISNLVNNNLDANKVNTTIPTDNNTKDAEVASIGAIKDLVKTTDDKAEQNKSNIASNLNQTNTNKSDIATANTKIGDNTSLANKNKSDIANNLNLANANKTNIATNLSLVNTNKTDIANLKTDKLDASKVNTIIPADDSKNSEAANIGAIKTYISNNISNYNSGKYININSSTKTIEVLTTSTISDTDKTNLPTCKAVADYVSSNNTSYWTKNAENDLIYDTGLTGKTVGIDKTTGNLYIGLGWINNSGKDNFGFYFNGNFINFRGTLMPYTYTKTQPPSEDIGRYDYQLRNVFSSNIVSGDDTNKADENLSLKSAKDGAVIIKNGTSNTGVTKLEIKGINSTFSTNIIPNQTKTQNIGAADNKWNEIHTENLSATNIINTKLNTAYEKAEDALVQSNNNKTNLNNKIDKSDVNSNIPSDNSKDNKIANIGAVKSYVANNSISMSFHKGMIIDWYGKASEVPQGWAICNGQNGTPDLSGVFIRAASSANETAVLNSTKYEYKTAKPKNDFTTNNISNHTHSVNPPSTNTNSESKHTHTGSTNKTGSHNHLIGGDTATDVKGSSSSSGDRVLYNSDGKDSNENTGNAGSHSHTVTTGGGSAHYHSVDIGSFNSGSAGGHSHSITGGGDSETVPVHKYLYKIMYIGN